MQTTTPRLRTLVLFTPYAVVGILHIGALALDLVALSTFTKPLLMPLVLAGLLFALPRWRTQVALLASLAILFSWAGDVALASTGELAFLVGLGFFLLAHIAYLVVFLRKLRMVKLPTLAIVYALWWLGLVVVLAPHLGSLLIPVAVYGLVLGAMGALALRCDIRIAVGGALFVISDTLLGLDRFLPGFDLWQVHALILATYIGAQGLIALGIVRWAWRNVGRDPRSNSLTTAKVQ